MCSRVLTLLVLLQMKQHPETTHITDFTAILATWGINGAWFRSVTHRLWQPCVAHLLPCAIGP